MEFMTFSAECWLWCAHALVLGCDFRAVRSSSSAVVNFICRRQLFFPSLRTFEKGLSYEMQPRAGDCLSWAPHPRTRQGIFCGACVMPSMLLKLPGFSMLLPGRY
jgi:hypothetical protein